MKKSRKIVIVVSGIYLLFVVVATLYCLRTYYTDLPVAYLSKPTLAQIEYAGENKIKSAEGQPENVYDRALPRTCLYDDGSGKMKVNMIAEEDGPWGKKYIIKQTDVAYWPVNSDSENIVVLWRMDDSLPIAADIDSDYVYEGMEVKLQLK
jgi:hypothetical protein